MSPSRGGDDREGDTHGEYEVSTFGESLSELSEGELERRADEYLSRVESRHERAAEVYLSRRESRHERAAKEGLGFTGEWFTNDRLGFTGEWFGGDSVDGDGLDDDGGGGST